MSVAFRGNSALAGQILKNTKINDFSNFKSVLTRQYNELVYYCHIKVDRNY